MIRALAAIVLCVIPALSARSAPITYAFTGTVRQVSSVLPAPVSVGQRIPIVITLAAGIQAGQGTHGSEPAYYGGLTPNLFAGATFAGMDHAGGLVQSLTVVPNRGIDFRVEGLQTLFGFDLSLSGALPGTLPNGDIPRAIDASRFTRGTFSVVDAFSPEYYGYSGTIDLVAVPEPASSAIVFGGVLALYAARRRPTA